MNIDTEEYTNFTPIKNCEESVNQNKINGYLSEDTNSNCSANSNELFSDDDDKDDVMYYTPNVSQCTDPSFLNISEASLLHTNKQAQTPNFNKSAVIPSTPLGLIPFLTKINEQWTSDLETPQANKTDQRQLCMDKSLLSSDEKSVSVTKQLTPNTSKFKNQFNEATSTSPVINCTRMRRRTKRRIFKTTSIAIDTTIDPTQCENVIKNDQDNHEPVQLQLINQNNDVAEQGHVSKSQEISPTDNNISSQDFFCNASFANIDQICANYAEKNEACSIANNDITNFNKDASEDDYKREVKESEVISMNDIGFATASGKQIHVSDSALSKAKSLLETDDMPSVDIPFVNKNDIKLAVKNNTALEVLPINNKSSNDTVSFTTAKGKVIEPSEEALKKAYALFADQIDDISCDSTNTLLENTDINKNSSSETKRTGIALKDKLTKHQSSNLPNKITSKVSKLLAQQLHDNTLIEKRMCFKEHVNRNIETKKNSNSTCLISKEHLVQPITDLSIGFSTAVGRTINISKEALSKAEALFSNDIIDDKSNNLLDEPMDEEKNLHDLDVGFSTAAGCKINISKEALSKAEALFFNDMNDDKSNNLPNEPINKRNSLHDLDVGFSTAAGHKVNISKEALSKAEALFSNVINDDKSNNLLDEPMDEEKNLHDLDVGFSTAAGRKVNISKEALSKAEALLSNDIIDDKSNNLLDEPINKRKSLHDLDIGFSTASGRKVNVSKEALSKAEALLSNDIIDDKSNNLLDEPINKRKSVHDLDIGFSTASGHKVNISKEALSKAEALFFNDMNDDKSNNLPDEPINKRKSLHDINVGFSTAAGREVVISEEALSKAEALYSNDIKDDISNNLLDKPINKRKSLHVCDGTLDKLSLLNAKKVKLFDQNTTTENAKQALCDNTEIIASNNTFSNEIIASTAALLADEKNFEQNMEWISQAEHSEPKEKCKTPSPVIGRQLLPRKRGKKRSLQYNKKQEVTLNKSDTNTNINKQSCVSNYICTKNPVTKSIADILQERLAAISEQEKAIKEKKVNRPKAMIGKLLSYKQENYNARLSWKKLVGDGVPKLCTFEELINRDISSEILSITAATALSYKFRCSDFYGEETIQAHPGGFKMEDGGFLIPNENGYAGILEIERCFLASPGVDPNLLPTGWVENHYKWIVWKVASMDRIQFKSIDIPRALTPANVLLQLKYRYDREIDRSQRPCLRRILEKDDGSTKRMVLCVSSIMQSKDIESNEQSSKMSDINHWKMILTDGWYSIPASIDGAMMNYIASGKIREGTKLMIFGAELLNLDQGCPPLEIPEDVCLKIHTNSTRRARWYTKLGYAPYPGPMLIKLKDVSPHGGLIGKIKVLVTRAYPMLYHEKTSLGESVFRNSRCEEKASVAYEEDRRSKIEAFYAEAEKKFEKKMLNEQHAVEKFKEKLESKLRESLPPPRQISPVLKVRVSEDGASAILTIWTPSEDIMDTLKEGTCITIRNIIASGKRAGDLQLTTCRSTSFNKETTFKTFPQSRVYTPLQNVVDSSFNPLYGEFDTVGIVSSIVSSPYGMKNFEAVNIAYPHESTQEDTARSSYLSILFWQGVSSFGYAEILTTGSLVACSNLEWRRSTSWNIPVAYCTDRTVFTRNPRQSYLCEAFERFKDLVKMSYPAYAAKCAEEIVEAQKKAPVRTSFYGTPDKSTPDKMNMGSSKAADSNTRLDIRNVNSSSIKSAAIQRRLEKLQYYSEPPELSPLVLRNSSSKISHEFRPLIRNDNLKPTKLNMDQ